MATKRNKWVLAALVPSMMAACLSIPGAAKTKDPPWIAKDWTQWNEDDCDAVLNKSPWGQMVSTGGSNSTSLVAEIQFRSALPIQQALLRKQQLYEFYNKMKPDKKQTFDQAHAHDLDPSTKFLLHIGNDTNYFLGSGATGTPMPMPLTAQIPRQAALQLPDGALIQPIETTILGKESAYGNETQYSFPRTVGSRPLLPPTDSSLVIQLGAPLWVYDAKTNKFNRQDGPFQYSGTSITFKSTDLMYKGKLEY